MFGFEVPAAEVRGIDNETFNGAAVETATPPNGLIASSGTRRIAEVEGRVVDAECHMSERSIRDSYWTWRPIVPPCPYFG
jgi:hypothetical protein